MSTRPAADPVLEELRDEITELDRRLVEVVNERLRIVARLRRHKLEQGIPLLDPAREQWLRAYLTRENAGPLSDEGVAELHAHVLELTKRELRDA